MWTRFIDQRWFLLEWLKTQSSLRRQPNQQMPERGDIGPIGRHAELPVVSVKKRDHVNALKENASVRLPTQWNVLTITLTLVEQRGKSGHKVIESLYLRENTVISHHSETDGSMRKSRVLEFSLVLNAQLVKFMTTEITWLHLAEPTAILSVRLLTEIALLIGKSFILMQISIQNIENSKNICIQNWSEQPNKL